MNLILNPDIAFVILGVTLLITIFALLAPGSGILEVLALIFLIMVGYAVANLPVNAWAIALVLIGIVLMVVAFRRTKKWTYLAGSIAILVIGMVFVFKGENGLLGVNPLLAVTVSVAIGTFIWILGRNISATFHQKPYSDLNRLSGMVGTATTDISDSKGSVYLAGEDWTAMSDFPISAGSQVKVLQRNGLVLKVELTEDEKKIQSK